ncbi:hypothetical protein DM02DRAFT_614938 [Periconia macrospinosa]|uniref:Uncharacterized protein n=1 Tax=Periconia macrospinosa TaxID=97972 RepID=A0A2V1DND7_9PLEO|nr:hypothetical protein DM02DRAFT_614938 [Periconia macrospinosa]
MHKLEVRTPVSLSHFPNDSRSPMQSPIIVVVIPWTTYPQPRQAKTTIHYTIRETRAAPARKDSSDLHASRITSIESEIDTGVMNRWLLRPKARKSMFIPKRRPL